MQSTTQATRCRAAIFCPELGGIENSDACTNSDEERTKPVQPRVRPPDPKWDNPENFIVDEDGVASWKEGRAPKPITARPSCCIPQPRFPGLYAGRGTAPGKTVTRGDLPSRRHGKPQTR